MRFRRSLAAAAAAVLIALPGPPDTGGAVPQARQPLRLELNVPAFRIDVWRDGARSSSFPVAVGAPRYPTPRGDFAITEITWNPWWYPPPSEWAREDTVTPPGPRNPMGRVKLRLDAAYYVHGTPLEQSIGSAASHGCIRMLNADAIALARQLQESAGMAMTDGELELLLASRTTRLVMLPDSVSVAVVYRTAEVFNDTLSLHPDVYQLKADRTGEAVGALRAAGLDSAQIDERILAVLLRASRARAVHVSLDSVRVRIEAQAHSLSGAYRARSCSAIDGRRTDRVRQSVKRSTVCPRPCRISKASSPSCGVPRTAIERAPEIDLVRCASPSGWKDSISSTRRSCGSYTAPCNMHPRASTCAPTSRS
jgi:hypothetical protein